MEIKTIVKNGDEIVVIQAVDDNGVHVSIPSGSETELRDQAMAIVESGEHQAEVIELEASE